ncbi:hypothetical protein GW17_00034254 [Ensete ventricosum]|nr:hypothetical protein GW17_00034254 [Ensete ventricosum]
MPHRDGGTRRDPSDIQVNVLTSFRRILACIFLERIREQKKEKKNPLPSTIGRRLYITKRWVDHTLGLTFVDTLGEVTAYNESVGAEVWRKGVACHAALMTRGEGSADVSSDRFHLGADVATELLGACCQLRGRPLSIPRGSSRCSVDSCDHHQGVLWRGLFGDMAEMHSANKLAEIHSLGENC